MKYPTWRYHRELAPCIVADPHADAALGPGWADTPAAFVEPDVRARLAARLDELEAPVPADPASVSDAPVDQAPALEVERIADTPAPVAVRAKRKR
jgi:hypothetical protein